MRNWFTFSASEKWTETGEEFEHFTDSGGKSGGQKEKLAYTILAAALAFQFGLASGQGTGRSAGKKAHSGRSFRFVVIDEAFGRGSDESARYGLELFQRMKLQLLIVTPLQKIHVIEPFVSHVGFVANTNGDDSQLRNMTIQEYRDERDRRAGVRAPSRASGAGPGPRWRTLRALSLKAWNSGALLRELLEPTGVYPRRRPLKRPTAAGLLQRLRRGPRVGG